jgi:hypothetical protein
VVVKWLTYALVLHIVALGLSAGSAVFGLLAHVREMSMTCCSTCVSGFAAAVALLAFVFDLAIFFLAKARINAIGSAEIGNAIWLTLAAWILLFFSGCFYTLGRCCITKRKPRNDWSRKGSESGPIGAVPTDQMRMDAVKDEADRKARQKEEVGLPAFHEVQPLAAHIEGNNVYLDTPYKDDSNPAYGGKPARGGGYAGGGYVQAPLGSRAVDEYYSPTQTNFPAITYPPAPQQGGGYAPTAAFANVPKGNSLPQQPQRQGSGYAQSQYAPSQYAPSMYVNNAANPTSPPLPNQYLSATPHQYGPDRYGSPPNEYSHSAGGTSCESTFYSIGIATNHSKLDHTAASHGQQATSYSQYDPYESPQPHTGQAYNASYDNYNQMSPPMPHAGYASHAATHYSAQTQPGPERSYSLGGASYSGDGYGASSVPPLPEHDASYFPPPGDSRGPPAPINTTTVHVPPSQPSPIKGPRAHTQLAVRNDMDDSPPVYDAGTSNVQGAWGKR